MNNFYEDLLKNNDWHLLLLLLFVGLFFLFSYKIWDRKRCPDCKKRKGKVVDKNDDYTLYQCSKCEKTFREYFE